MGLELVCRAYPSELDNDIDCKDDARDVAKDSQQDADEKVLQTERM